MNATATNPEFVLRSANRRLAELLNEDAPPLSEGGARAIQDRLWVWGIVGGKDVGKTTLINALAGAEVCPYGREVGEGTFRPAAYLAADDLAQVQHRFAGLNTVDVTYNTDGPDAMGGLALVDLPDFDSFFHRHVEQVRSIATVLDGIIWVTTPRKLRDLKATEEIRAVLKARSNFVYVVNKIDWLIGQTDQPPQQALERVSSALAGQVADCDPEGAAARCFVIAARYRDPDSLLDSIARLRGMESPDAVRDGNGELATVTQTVVDNFAALKQALTTAPTADAALANKQANLTYQVRRQAEQLLEHYRPGPLLDRLAAADSPDAIRETVARSFSPGYCERVYERLNAGRSLFVEWSTSLFRRRIAHWSLLGIIAWPLALLGSALGGLRSLVTGERSESADPFRAEGLSLEDRADAVTSHLHAELAGVAKRVPIELPPNSTLVQQFRAEATTLAEEQRRAVIQPLLHRQPGPIGRLLRWCLPIGILLWFPLIQPVLAAWLHAGLRIDRALIQTVVSILSAGSILTGLGASLVVLAILTAVVYSRAVRDTFRAVERLESSGAELTADQLIDSLATTVRRPIEDVHHRLTDCVNELTHLASDEIGPRRDDGE